MQHERTSGERARARLSLSLSLSLSLARARGTISFGVISAAQLAYGRISGNAGMHATELH